MSRTQAPIRPRNVMAWPGMDEEDAFTKMLESVTHYDMDGPMLLLLSDGELRAVFQARP